MNKVNEDEVKADDVCAAGQELRACPDREDAKAQALEDKLAWIASYLERSKIAEYVDLMNKPARLVYLNLLGGLARGVGLAVGFTILGALVIYLLTRSFLLNLPVIGEFLGELVYIVQQYLRHRP